MNMPPQPSSGILSALAMSRLSAGADTLLLKPAPTLLMGRCFYYPVLGVSQSLMHTPNQITGLAWLTPRALLLHFQALPDAVTFHIDRARLHATLAWSASYALCCATRPTAPIVVSYAYSSGNTKGDAINNLLNLSELAPQLTGNVTITVYDARRQLLSGYYEVRAPDQRDPTTSAPVAPTCTIQLAGDFDQVKVRS